MTKEEFFELVIKNELGKCSEEEKKLLEEYCDRVQSEEQNGEWDLMEMEESKTRTFQKINQTILQHQKSEKKSRWLWWTGVAASILMIVFMAVFISIQQQEQEVFPESGISLTMPDGNTISLADQGNHEVKDHLGNVVAYQSGNRISYPADLIASSGGVHKLTVPAGKTYKVTLSDQTSVHLNAGSSLSYFTGQNQSSERRVTLSGEAYLDVAKDPSRPFIVRSKQFQVQVYGTQFNVQAYPEDQRNEVVLVEGSVGMNTVDKHGKPDGVATVKLTPGLRAQFDPEDHKFSTARVATDQYTNWTSGMLIIRNLSFDEMMVKLERTFGVRIVNRNEVLAREIFNANFGKNPTIEQVLQELQYAFGFSYEINKNDINIY